MTSALHLKLNDASIWFLPSVHFRLAFVEEVNRLCSSEKPDAVVVELGPQTAAAATAWLRDLSVGPGPGSLRLPCMLGLIKPNRRIRASFRAAAVRLQELTGKELHELAPEVLRENLGYSAVSILPLSSTDSIVEALRCALELNRPLYGVDVEDTAERRQKTIMLQDPASAADEFEKYVTHNVAFAEQQRDEEIDARRELAMAARLKALSEKHRRIVFVCGLAHWRKLLTLLQTPELKPAPYPQVSEQELSMFQRVIMDPRLAIYHLDTFPVFSAEYEGSRKNASQQRTKYARARDWHEVFLDMLQDAYKKQFVSEGSGEQLDRALEDWEAKNDFEQLLRNFCTLRQCRTPDFFSTVAVARGVMSEKFCNTLAETFMDIEWAKRDKYPDLPILAPSPSKSGSNQHLRAELIDFNGRSSEGFFVQSLPGRCSVPMNIPISWKWEDAPPPYVPPPSEEPSTETWIPTEDLINALLFRAVRIARETGAGPQVEVFEGSLLDGVDMKTTLRSAARGEDQIFVRAQRRQRIRFLSSDEDIDSFPVVWIFRLMEGAQWKFSADELSKLSAGTLSDQWTTAGLERAGCMVTSVARVTDSHTDEKLSTPDYTVTTESIVGKLSYWPQCCESRTAKWALETKLTRNPVCSSPTFDSLSQFYRERYALEIGDLSWHVTLIRMAIPLAKKAITVVAPDGYVLPRIVHQEAAVKRIQVRVVPLSYFPSHVLRRMSHLVWLPVLRREFDKAAEIDIPVFPEHVIRHFNEPLDAYRRLIPAKWH